MSRYEQPTYTVIATFPNFEVRHYPSYLVAETTVPGTFESSGNEAFRRLAGFIFGNNRDGKRMNMTAPVTHEAVSDGAHRYRFVMEQAYSEETLPLPLDEAIDIVRVPAGYYAALRYRGNPDERRFRRVERSLLAGLERGGFSVTGLPAIAVYDGPMVPSMVRRNEVLVPVEWPEVPAVHPPQ